MEDTALLAEVGILHLVADIRRLVGVDILRLVVVDILVVDIPRLVVEDTQPLAVADIVLDCYTSWK